jgi:hypothetical protein
MLPTLTVPAIDSQKRTVETLIHVLRLVLTAGQTTRTVSLVATSFSLTNLQRYCWSGCGCLASARYGATSRRWRWDYTIVLFDTVRISGNEVAAIY